MTYIFLSYSHLDSDVMQVVDQALREAGMEVWTDVNLTPGTSSWKNAIERAIEEAACVVVLLSPAAKESASVELELDYASLHELTIFPLLIKGDKRTSVPFELGTTQWADLRSDRDTNLKRVISTLRNFLGLITPDSPIPSASHSESKSLRTQFADAMKASKWNVAIEIGMQLLVLEPADQELSSILARVYWQYGGALQIEYGSFEDNPYKQSMALTYFDRAIRLDPQQPDYYFSRGMLHKRMDNLPMALADFQQASRMGHARARGQISKLT